MKVEEKLVVAREGLRGFLRGNLLGAAASLVSGVAMQTVPQTILWGAVTVGTSTVIVPTVVAVAAFGGGAVCAIGAAIRKAREVREVNALFGE